VLFRQSPTSGRLTFSCDACDLAGYADPGGAAHKKFSAAMKPEPGAPVPPPPGDPAPTPPAPPPRPSFGPGAFA